MHHDHNVVNVLTFFFVADFCMCTECLATIKIAELTEITGQMHEEVILVRFL